MTFEHFYQCVPPKTTAQTHKKVFKSKTGRMFVGTDAKGKALQSELAAIFMSRQPPVDFPRESPCRVLIGFVFPYRKSEKRQVVRDRRLVPNTSRPDLDNMAKAVCDILTLCNFWNDDAQVYRLTLEKWFHDTPGIYLRIDTENPKQKEHELCLTT